MSQTLSLKCLMFLGDSSLTPNLVLAHPEKQTFLSKGPRLWNSVLGVKAEASNEAFRTILDALLLPSGTTHDSRPPKNTADKVLSGILAARKRLSFKKCNLVF